MYIVQCDDQMGTVEKWTLFMNLQLMNQTFRHVLNKK